jgi:serine protease Do
MVTKKSSIFYGLLIAVSSLVVGMVIASRLDLTPHSSAANGPLTIPATNSAPLSGPIDATTFRNVAAQAGPAVVSITTRQRQPVRQPNSEMEEFFGFPIPAPPTQNRRRGEPPAGEVPEVPAGAGSGFIIDKAGYILTNNHVIENASSIEVYLSTMHQMSDGLPARVVGRDALTDTALLQLERLPSTELAVAKFGDSGQMAPGDWVVAIGNPFGLSNTVTAGIVSAVGRQTPIGNYRTEDFIQTDAAINRGNSGGPLLNIRGEVIGINSMIFTDNRFGGGGNIGVGFAIPINTVRDLLPQLHEGKVTRGRIGVFVNNRPISEEDAKELGLPSTGGAEIQQAIPGGPAEKAGMRAGDVVVDFNGKTVRNNNELVSLVTATRPGTSVPVKVVRGGKTITLNVTVEELDFEAEQTESAEPRDNGGRGGTQDTGIGMSITPLTPQLQRQMQVPSGRGGAIVSNVTPFGPAAQGQVLQGDVILTVQGRDVSSPQEVTAAVAAVAPGRLVRIIVWRYDEDTRQGQEVLVQVRKR